MIRRRKAATNAIILTLLIVSCSRTKDSSLHKAGSPTSTLAGTQSPTIAPAASVSEWTPQFSGEISRGQRFEKAVAPGMIFSLEPYPVDDSGWEIRLAPDTEPSPASIDCIGAISEPRHGNRHLSIEVQDGKVTQETSLGTPHEFDFVATPLDCKRAWDLANSINYSYNLTDQQRDELNDKLSQIPTGQGQLKVIDSRLGAPSPTGKPRAIEWIKFELHLQFPQSPNPTIAKAESNNDPDRYKPPVAVDSEGPARSATLIKSANFKEESEKPSTLLKGPDWIETSVRAAYRSSSEGVIASPDGRFSLKLTESSDSEGDVAAYKVTLTWKGGDSEVPLGVAAGALISPDSKYIVLEPLKLIDVDSWRIYNLRTALKLKEGYFTVERWAKDGKRFVVHVVDCPYDCPPGATIEYWLIELQ